MTNKPTGARGAAYIRVSDGEKQDPQRQRETCSRWALNRELTIAHWYSDIEGRNPRGKAERRVQFQQLLTDVQAGKWDWIIVDSQDRFGTKDAFEFMYFCHILRQSNCQLWSVSQGHLTGDDIATPIIGTVNAGASKQELLEKGKRNVSGKRSKAALGEWQGGYVPYGYDVVCVTPDGKEKWRVVIEKMLPKEGLWQRVRIYPNGTVERFDGDGVFPAKEQQDKFRLAPSCRSDRVQIAREIFQLYADGAWTLRSLCKRLNDRSLDPIYGEGWYVSRLAPMLRNPVYYVGQTVWGKMSHGEYAQYVGGEYIVPSRVNGLVKAGRKNAIADWVFPKHTEAILDKALWDEVQKKLIGDGIRKRGLRNPELWLAGLLYCGRCGVRMSGACMEGECHFVCETFRKFGHTPVNKTGCRLHRTKQELVERYLTRYLEEMAPQVKALLDASSQPSLTISADLRQEQLGDELYETLCRMSDVANQSGYEGKTLFQKYQAWLEGERPILLDRIKRKKREIEELVERFASLPRTARAALEAASRKAEALQVELDNLEAEAEPLNNRLDVILAEMRELGSNLEEAKGALSGDDMRRKAEVVRRVVAKVVLHFRHYEHKNTDPRSKNRTIPKSALEKVEVIPWQGLPMMLPRLQGSAASNTLEHDGLSNNLLSLLLRRVYHVAENSRNGPSEQVRETVLRLHSEGRKVCEIAREVHLDRKQVSRILAHEGIKNAPSVSASSRLPEILELREQGLSLDAIGDRLGFSRNAIARALTGK